MGGFRTDESEQKYKAYRAAGGLDNGCRMCDAPTLKTFAHWRIIDNKFPYDKIASTHHILVSLVHAAGKEVPAEAWAELDELKHGYINDTYDFIIEPMPHKRTIPAHFHLHLVIPK